MSWKKTTSKSFEFRIDTTVCAHDCWLLLVLRCHRRHAEPVHIQRTDIVFYLLFYTCFFLWNEYQKKWWKNKQKAHTNRFIEMEIETAAQTDERCEEWITIERTKENASGSERNSLHNSLLGFFLQIFLFWIYFFSPFIHILFAMQKSMCWFECMCVCAVRELCVSIR